MTLFTMLTPELYRTLDTYELIMLSEAKPAGSLLLAAKLGARPAHFESTSDESNVREGSGTKDS